jgi:pimeloyl-ACP methyl ester carboxylesterase
MSIMEAVMKTVQSKDGTTIAFDQLGEGPALILVAGASGVRRHYMVVELAEMLAAYFTIYNYDRRGRGDSSDTLPYGVQREIEDIEALIDHAGGSAFVYGVSSGAALVLEAASALPGKIEKIVLYEPPFVLDGSHPPLPENYVQNLTEYSATGRRGDAVALFLSVVGVPEEYISQMKTEPGWAEMEAVAHTLAYDGTIMDENMSGKMFSDTTIQRWSAATCPTLVLAGGNSEPFFRHSGQVLADVLPNARFEVVPEQDHAIASAVLTPYLVEFFQM